MSIRAMTLRLGDDECMRVSIVVEKGLEARRRKETHAAVCESDTQKGRTHDTIQVSFDDGLTWPESHHRLLDEGRGAGYPSLTQIDKDHVGIVDEGSQSHFVFQKFKVTELGQLTSADSKRGSR